MYNAGLVFARANNLSMARSSFQTAVDEDPQWAEPRIWLGMISALENDPLESRRHLEEARQIDPQNAIVSESIGLACLVLGLNSEAEKNFQQARSLGREVTTQIAAMPAGSTE